MSTIYDVARLAGVSHTAVSAVINGNKKHKVGPEKQRMILEAIKELGYKPSKVARQLRTGTSNIIGVCFGTPFRHVFIHPFNGAMISAIGESVSECGYDVLIKSTSGGAAIEEILRDLPSLGVAGVVVVGPINLKKQMIEAIDSSEIPLVCIDSYRGFSKASTVDVDNVTAAARATEHLISQGHRRITYIGRPPVYQCFVDRVQGFCNALQEHNILVDENSVRVADAARIRDSIAEILNLQDRPTAILCSESSYAAVVAETIAASGLHIPEDIALLSFDAAPASMDPERVSVVAITPYEMGNAAAEVLKKLLSGEVSEPVNIRIPAHFELKP